MRMFLSFVFLLLSTSSLLTNAAVTTLQSRTTTALPTEIDVNLTFDKFNPSLGTLTTITLVVTGSGLFDISLTNNALTTQSVRGTASTEISVVSTLFAVPASVPLSATTGSQNINPAQTVAFDDLPGNNVVSFAVTFNGATMSNFVGAGQTVPIRFTSLSGLTLLGGGGQIESSQTTLVTVAATLQYTYTEVAQVQGDPQFAGFQGQHFQFHGLPDTVFNLVSAPELQMNAHFVYIASGVCNYNETACFSHAGTYLGTVGVAIGSQNFTIVSGPHSKGLRLFADTAGVRYPISVGSHFTFNTVHGKMSIAIPSSSNVEIRSPHFAFNLVNSDSFLNLEASLLDTQLLRAGAKQHHVKHCENAEAVEQSLTKHYPVKNYIHGLVGQTWRAATFCATHAPYQGGVGDYIASDLFSNDYRFNFFNPTN